MLPEESPRFLVERNGGNQPLDLFLFDTALQTIELGKRIDFSHFGKIPEEEFALTGIAVHLELKALHQRGGGR